ncbi:hypothetical protein [Streptomyces sp. AC550_RSS872]|uniref:hypothetical protein n=1 Tax=Streptomyces sp. AC550_RSS872 TaxID=2823689 RepID=UPI0035AB6AC5
MAQKPTLRTQLLISIAYVADPSGGGHGVLADETALVGGGTATETEGLETSLGAWSVTGPPAGSPAVPRDRTRTGTLFRTYGATTTDGAVLLGFGLEHVTAATDRKALIGKALGSPDD